MHSNVKFGSNLAGIIVISLLLFGLFFQSCSSKGKNRDDDDDKHDDMCVTLQVDLGEMLTYLTDNPTDNFKKAIENTDNNPKSNVNYFSTFIEEYKKLNSGVDFKSGKLIAKVTIIQ